MKLTGDRAIDSNYTEIDLPTWNSDGIISLVRTFKSLFLNTKNISKMPTFCSFSFFSYICHAKEKANSKEIQGKMNVQKNCFFEEVHEQRFLILNAQRYYKLFSRHQWCFKFLAVLFLMF